MEADDPSYFDMFPAIDFTASAQSFQNMESQSQREALQGIQQDGTLQNSRLPYPPSVTFSRLETDTQPATPLQLSASDEQPMYGPPFQSQMLAVSQ
ncbi:hypothetical protein FQN49_005285, partial [Arthroderma sp. PD_2]